MYRAHLLAHAYACCKANKGAAGVDEQEFADVEAYGPRACCTTQSLAVAEPQCGEDTASTLAAVGYSAGLCMAGNGGTALNLAAAWKQAPRLAMRRRRARR